jgi:hypothetical protein
MMDAMSDVWISPELQADYQGVREYREKVERDFMDALAEYEQRLADEWAGREPSV